jgi:hypothetical protein
MEKKLHLLDSFSAKGSDGSAYKVMAYEHMVCEDLLRDGKEHWEPTGLTEYRLADGTRVDVASDGSMQVGCTGVKLQMTEGARSRAKPPARPGG